MHCMLVLSTAMNLILTVNKMQATCPMNALELILQHAVRLTHAALFQASTQILSHSRTMEKIKIWAEAWEQGYTVYVLYVGVCVCVCVCVREMSLRVYVVWCVCGMCVHVHTV